ncbi:CHASE domain-containing protein [Undibacterium arcticum]
MGLIITQSLFVSVSRLEHDKAALNFRQQADLRIAAVRQGLEEAVQVLTVLNQLFATVEPVSRAQFHSFTQPLLQRYPYIQAFNFHRLVSLAERPAYEAEMRQHTPGFVVTELGVQLQPARIRPSYSVVDYLEPMAGNEPAFGLDASLNSHYVAATRRALETGQPASTDLLRLAQGRDGQRGFLVVMPVYRRGSAPTDFATRSNLTIGDTAAVFRAGALVEKNTERRRFVERAGHCDRGVRQRPRGAQHPGLSARRRAGTQPHRLDAAGVVASIFGPYRRADLRSGRAVLAYRGVGFVGAVCRESFWFPVDPDWRHPVQLAGRGLFADAGAALTPDPAAGGRTDGRAASCQQPAN